MILVQSVDIIIKQTLTEVAQVRVDGLLHHLTFTAKSVLSSCSQIETFFLRIKQWKDSCPYIYMWILKKWEQAQLKDKSLPPLLSSADSKSRAIIPFLGGWLGQHHYLSLLQLQAQICNNVSLYDQLSHEIFDFTEYTELACRSYHLPHLATVYTDGLSAAASECSKCKLM